MIHTLDIQFTPFQPRNKLTIFLVFENKLKKYLAFKNQLRTTIGVL